MNILSKKGQRAVSKFSGVKYCQTAYIHGHALATYSNAISADDSFMAYEARPGHANKIPKIQTVATQFDTRHAAHRTVQCPHTVTSNTT